MESLNDLAIMTEQSKSRAGGFLQFVSEYVLNDITFKTKLSDQFEISKDKFLDRMVFEEFQNDTVLKKDANIKNTETKT